MFIFVFFLLVWGWRGFSFANQTTHPKLTWQTIEFYNNRYSSSKISSKEAEWIIKGSIEEDEPVLRCQNHFYDPQTGQGLSDGKYRYLPTISAPDWANSPPAQSVAGMGGDHSWQQAIYYYQQGDKKKAFQKLGHVLHLLQDMGVPAHVRDDAHEAGDPFENWAKENNANLTVDLSKAEKMECDNNRQCFFGLSSYTHNNFFSQDSITLDSPKKEIQYLYKNGIRIIHWDKANNEYVFDKKIHQSYWNHLSPKVVGYGAGLIDLFFQKVKAEKAEEPDSALEYAWKEVKKEAELMSEFAEEKTNETVEKISGVFDSVAGVFEKTGEKEREVEGGEKDGKEIASKKEKGRVKGVKKTRDPKPGTQDLEVNENSEYKGKESEGEGEKSQRLQKEEEKSESKKVEEIGEPKSKTEKIEKNNENKEIEKIGVAYVVDGDTIILEDGRKVRYIGIDTPELGEEGGDDDEYLAWKARLRNMELLKGDNLQLVKDPNMNKDKYGRLLRYVYIDGKSVSKILVREGMASVFFCRPGWENCDPPGDKQRKKEIEQAGKYAMERNLGVYNEQEKQLAEWKKDSQEYQSADNAEGKEDGNREVKQSSEKEGVGGNAGSGPSSNMPLYVRSGGGSSDDEDKEEEKEKENKQSKSNKNKEDNNTQEEQDSGGEDSENQQNEEQTENNEQAKEGSSKEDKKTDHFPSVSLTKLDVYDPVTGNAAYTASTTVQVDIATTSAVSLPVKYYLSDSSSTPSATSSEWKEDPPNEFTFKKDRQGEKTVYAWLMTEGELSTSTASSTIFVDTQAPSSTIIDLADSYDSYNIPLQWQGEDAGDVSAGIKEYETQYKIGENGVWKVLASATTSTSTNFKHATTSDNMVYFKARAEDKAGNVGEWSVPVFTEVNIDKEADNPVISEVHPSDYQHNDDFTNYWVELYNPLSEDIDLASAGYRIERTTGSSYNFMEFGNTDHGTFWGETVISAQSYYLVVEQGCSEELKQQADAIIAEDRDFALTGGNAVSLATGHVSSSTDEDIVDLVGYGDDAPFYEGNGPAPVPSSLGVKSIERKIPESGNGHSYDSDDNEYDFLLQPDPNPRATGNNQNDLISSTQELIEDIEQNIQQERGISKKVTIGSDSTTTLLQIAEGTSYINTETGQVVARDGSERDNSALAGPPDAPLPSDPVGVEDLPASVVKMEISPNDITPSEFQVRAGQVVALSVTAGEEETETFRFEDPNLSGVVVGVAPGITRIIVFNAPVKIGEYPYYSDISNHKSSGAKGVMKVK